MKRIFTAILSASLFISLFGQSVTPEIYSWTLNNGETASYYLQGNSTPVNTSLPANCQQVRYSANNVYVDASGLPAYPIGPYLDGNPAQAGNKAYLFRIPRNPQQNTGTLTSTRLGHIGVLINGVPVYNASDAMSYNNQGIWFRDAIFFENDGFDCAKGHPAPDMQAGLSEGRYHHHQNPIPFNYAANPTSGVCTQYPSSSLYTPNPSQHSPLIGYAFDGYPIYGSYGYDDPNDPNSSIVRIESSYQLRNITQRTTLPDGSTLTPAQYGPAIDNTYPLGAFIEDYEFIQGSGHLDEHNGRFCITPEYPAGTYAYFATIDANDQSAYPYFIGPEYYGVVATDNFPTPGPGGGGTNVVVNEPVTVWTGATGISDADLLNQHLLIFPNPARDRLNIRIDESFPNISGEVRNLMGQSVLPATGFTYGDNSLEISGLDPGAYILRIYVGESVLNKKFLKQ